MSFIPISQHAEVAETHRDEAIYSWLVDQQVYEFASLPWQNATDWTARTKEIDFLPVWRLEVYDQGSDWFCFW